MDYVVDFLKKIWHLLVYIIGIISGIMGILCFFGIDYSKLKPFILSAINKFQNCVYRIKQNITHKYKKAKFILFLQYLNVVRINYKMINILVISIVPLSRKLSKKICFCLLFIIIFNLYPIVCKDENDYLNRNTVNSKIEYVASGNANNQFYEKNISENNAKLKNSNGSIFYTDTNETDLEEVIGNEIETLRNRCKENIPLDSEGSSEAYFYSKTEADLFSNNYEFIPSDLLDQIIEGREKLYELYPSGNLAWLLANSYQAYAYNLLKQKNKNDNILYFYMQSIYYAKESIEFDIDAENKEMRIRYIQMRYRDIASSGILDNATRAKVYDIYNAFNNILDTPNTESSVPKKIEKW